MVICSLAQRVGKCNFLFKPRPKQFFHVFFPSTKQVIMKLKELESILQDCDVFGKNVNNVFKGISFLRQVESKMVKIV